MEDTTSAFSFCGALLERILLLHVTCKAEGALRIGGVAMVCFPGPVTLRGQSPCHSRALKLREPSKQSSTCLPNKVIHDNLAPVGHVLEQVPRKVVHVTITFCKIWEYRSLIHTAVHDQDRTAASMFSHLYMQQCILYQRKMRPV